MPWTQISSDPAYFDAVLWILNTGGQWPMLRTDYRMVGSTLF
jgi:hypothetical protein